MATLHPPLNGLSVAKHDLQARVLGWHTVGSCNITVNDPYHFAASGRYNALGRSGTFDLKLDLTDEDPTVLSGPCTVTNAGQTFSGTYTRNGMEISFATSDHKVTISPDGQDVILEASGYPKVRILG
ncbi:MAG: hypothetical protein WA431_03620 [Candidatus Cybelea sp.]